jgi:thiol-disulfide isomerase/thioredoxin
MKRFLLGILAATCFAAIPSTAAQLPRKAGELVIKSPSGMETLLSKYKGKVVALEFILTTCPHCQQSCKILTKMHHEFGSQGFTPVAVAINDMAHMFVTDFVKNFGISFPVGWQVRDNALVFLQRSEMEPLMMPQLAFIDKEGMIRSQFAGNDPFFVDDLKQEANMRAEIKALLQPTAKKAAANTPAPPSAPKKKG